MGLGVDVVFPLQSIGKSDQGLATPWISAEGTTTSYVKFDVVVSNSSIRILEGIIELSSRIHKNDMKVLVDNGSTYNYISD